MLDGKFPTTPAITVTAFADATEQSLIGLKLGGRADNWAPSAGVCVHAGVPAGWAPRASVYTHALRGVWSREADEAMWRRAEARVERLAGRARMRATPTVTATGPDGMHLANQATIRRCRKGGGELG
jgi:hypothetical protein